MPTNTEETINTIRESSDNINQSPSYTQMQTYLQNAFANILTYFPQASETQREKYQRYLTEDINGLNLQAASISELIDAMKDRQKARRPAMQQILHRHSTYDVFIDTIAKDFIIEDTVIDAPIAAADVNTPVTPDPIALEPSPNYTMVHAYLTEVRSNTSTHFPSAKPKDILKYQTYLQKDIDTLNPQASSIDELVITIKNSRQHGRHFFKKPSDYDKFINAISAHFAAKTSTPEPAIELTPPIIVLPPPPDPEITAREKTEIQARNADITAKCEQIIARLTEYKGQREKEWSFHYNFLGIMSVIYYVLDAITGNSDFNSKHCSTKISATDKLISHLNQSNSNCELSDAEKKALNECRLGALIASSGGLDTITELGKTRLAMA